MRFGASAKAKPNRLLLLLYHRCTFKRIIVLALQTTILSVVVYLCLWLFRHSQCYSREAGIVWKEAPIHSVHRQCPAVDYAILRESPGKICLTTLTDRQSSSVLQRLLRCRDFDAVGRLTWPNHQSYASKHGYFIRDSSDLIDTSRPPAWSKILAVLHLLEQDECDFVMWLDADTVVMNSDIRIESFLPADPDIHLVATYDRRFVVNSGVWLLRNSEWSRQFLHNWWNKRTFVREPGLSLSGDNAAFGYQAQELLKSAKDRRHIRVVPRCTFNSFGVFLTDHELETSAKDNLQSQEWYLSDKFYHEGDFIAHASGIDQKAKGVEMLLKRAK